MSNNEKNEKKPEPVFTMPPFSMDANGTITGAGGSMPAFLSPETVSALAAHDAARRAAAPPAPRRVRRPKPSPLGWT